MDKELKCPECGANLLAKQNTVYRNVNQVECFSIENRDEGKYLQFNHCYDDGESPLYCVECNKDINDLIKDLEMEF